MTERELIDDIFAKEGDRYAEPPEIDQPTGPGGIVIATMTEYLGRQATVTDLKTLSRQSAWPIVKWKLTRLSLQAGLHRIAFEPLRLQLLDFAYNSGPSLAIRWLQRVLRVNRTGVMDSDTVWALQQADGFLVNQALIAARLEMIDRWTDADQQRKAWEEGLESRGLKFSLLVVP